MNSQRDSRGSVLAIVDPVFGEKLRRVHAWQPVWIAMSPTNDPVVRSMWAGQAAPDHLTGVTGFDFDESVSAEDLFLAQLDSIDLHHGPYSSASPYTERAVVGTRPTSKVRAGLLEFGFTDLTATEDGFVARRTLEAAMRRRE